jgi:charged multivesicular body protein 4
MFGKLFGKKEVV